MFEIRLRAVVVTLRKESVGLAGGPLGLGALMDAQSGQGEGRGRMLRRYSAVLGVLAFLVVGACDGSAGVDSTTTTNSDTSVVTSPMSTTSNPTTTTTPSTTTTVDASVEVLQAWDVFWQAWAALRASEDLDPAPLEAVATPDVVAGVVALFERQRESGAGPVETEVVTHGTVTEVASGEVVVEDCVLLSPSFTESVGVWHQADMRNSGSDWVVADLRIRSGSCVPEEMAADAIAAYDSFYEGWSSFWDPPDPDHPLIAEVLADPQRSLIVGVLEEHQARGVALRGRPTTHPEVVEVRNPTELVILDCNQPDSEYGVYDLTTGERLSDEPPVREGQRSLRSAVMVFEQGRWKVSDLQGQVDFECEFAPTERGLPSV